MLKVIGLILFWGSVSWAQIMPNIELYPGESITLNEAVLAAYPLDNLRVITVEVRQGYPIIMSNRTGDSLVQLLKMDGSIDTLLIKVKNKDKDPNRFIKRGSEGYSVRARAFYNDAYYNHVQVDRRPEYGMNVSLFTKVKNQSSFFGTYTYNNNRIDSFFTKFKHKQVYAAYGDETVLSPEVMPSFIQRPQLRQGILGYEGDVLRLDIWQGGPSKGDLDSRQDFSSFKNRASSNSYNPYQVDYDSMFYGARGSLLLGDRKQFSLFASTWNYDQFLEPINYYGARWNALGGSLILRGSVGGISERPTYNYNVSYVNMTEYLKWFKTLRLYHEMAPKGYDSLYYFNLLPLERIRVDNEWSSLNNLKDGVWYVRPNYGYGLDGFYRRHNYGATLGWKNGLVDGYLLQSRSFSENTSDTTLRSDVNQIRPGFIFWLSEEEAPVRYRLEAYQNFNMYNSLGTSGSSQESSLRLARSWNRGNMEVGMRVARSVYVRDALEPSEGFSLAPYLSMRRGKLSVNAGTSFSFTDSLSDDGTSDLASSRTYLNSSYDFNPNWTLGARYSRSFVQYLPDRYNDGETYRLELIYRNSSNSSSILSLFDPEPVKGIVFEDINLNDQLDAGDKRNPGVQITLLQNDTVKYLTTTDSSGFFNFQNVIPGTYRMRVDSGQLSVKNLPSVISVQQGTEMNLHLALGKNVVKNVSFDFGKASAPELITMRQDCKMSGLKIFAIPKTGGTINIPETDECSLAVDVVSLNLTNVVVSNNNLPLTGESVKFVVTQNLRSLQGQIFQDKDNNTLWDDGEGLAGKFKLGGVTIESDEDGFFKVPLSKFKGFELKIDNFKFKRKNCIPSAKIIPLRGSNVTLSIKCQ